jgi:OOP family OmpA-OmpF porin
MNYSTLKKTVALSVVSLMAVGVANAQMSSDSTKMSSGTSTAKVFGGLGQYNTWSLGINAGATGDGVATGGINDYTHSKPELGYGLTLKDQLGASFGLQLQANGGKIAGNNGVNSTGFQTKFWSGTLSGVVNVGNLSFLHRSNGINFYLSSGAGLVKYKPSLTDVNGKIIPGDTYDHYATELIIPVGGGVKFKLSNQLDLNVGYTENFFDGINLDYIHDNAKFPAENRYSYGYAGLEYTFGSSSKPSLEWVNPVAMMYDELYDAALRQEVEALKGRVTNVETAVADLKKDSDGDGVSDQFDKCPNTPAGTVVDGAGCPIVFPKPDTIGKVATPVATAYANIQFEFDSSVLKTLSYPILDATSADLKASGKTITLAGYASSEGTAAHNMHLSKDRANSVKTYLVNSGVEAKHLKIKAFGETHPIADNSTEEGRIANRRVEFHQ